MGFDLGIVSAGEGSVSIMGSEGGMFMGPGQAMWSQKIKLAEGRPRADGRHQHVVDQRRRLPPRRQPAGKVFVQARAQLGERGFEGRVRKYIGTNDDGTFSFKDCTEGTYTIRVEGGDDEQSYEAQLTKIEVRAAQPVWGS